MHYETIATLADETFLIAPLEEGQAIHFNGNRHTAPAGEPIRVYGTGPVEISQGKWGNRLRVAGVYDGDYFDGSTLSTVPAESLTLQRQIGDGEWVTLSTGLAPDDAVTDPLPHLTDVNRYRAISKTALPTEAIGTEVDLTIGEKQWSYFNTGPGFGESYRIIGNPAVDQSTGRSSVVQHMAGLEYPTMVRGSLKTATAGISGTITPDSAQRADFEQLADTRLITCYRDPGGRRIFGNLGEISVAGTLIESISTEITRTHFVEVWNGTENTPEP